LSAVCLPAADHLAPFSFASLACTHPGLRRGVNEDAYLNRPDVGLWAVADGMGGHGAGDVASATVVDILARVSKFGSAFAFRREVRTALWRANNLLQQKAEEQLAGTIGAAVVALLAHGEHYACMWAGDSRAYLLRGGRLARVTHDHSIVQEMMDTGALSASEARVHRQAHVITRAVGALGRLDLDGVYGKLEGEDRFLLCSDGLTAVFDDAELAERLLGSRLEDLSRDLLAEALERGAPDNVTFVLVDARA
jgi:serine/threonine protein phosphatase PrpC